MREFSLPFSGSFKAQLPPSRRVARLVLRMDFPPGRGD